ncbi:ATP synthase subunit I [Maledivibacter halophilus]|uniref:ATP synthase I chain n=1 Tax=Maledivibacter halophilus TaxID=36842 RepID=A0A1T5JY90_9FIRM|nr:ATP synthase subunit I [Maledivibacter halophilus]SKC56363.1 ATP synthase I chain [Maledivibacter halophilus]
MNKTYELQVKIIKRVLVLLCGLIVIAFFASENPKPHILGYIFGGLIGILNFIHLGKTIEKAVTMNPGRAQGYTSSRYMLRYITTGIVIVVSLRADHLNGFATIIGLLLVKIAVFSTHLFDSKEYYKRIFKRREDNQ